MVPCAPLTVLNSNIESGTQGVYGDVINVLCHLGYMIDVISNVDHSDVMCGLDGTWQPQVTCTREYNTNNVQEF